MPCSAVTLSLATITAIVAVALMAIAFSTDNWLYIEVRRNNIKTAAVSAKLGDSSSHLFENLNSKYYYYTRTRGLFRICYPKERPPTVETYLSPVETHCQNVDYFIPDENNITKGLSEDAMARLHMARSTVALFIVAFFTVFIAFWTGVVGCWKRSPGNVTATAILMLVTCLLAAGAMALWHGVEYYEKDKIVGEEYYQMWDNVLQDNTSILYDWSYMLAWMSVGVFFISSVLFFCASTCLSKEKRKEQATNVQYIMPGLSLISAILFSSAAICLRGEREKEEALNMQYLMPVYPQKQQYAYAGYPPQHYPPGPYYHGSQYGPYNY